MDLGALACLLFDQREPCRCMVLRVLGIAGFDAEWASELWLLVTAVGPLDSVNVRLPSGARVRTRGK